MRRVALLALLIGAVTVLGVAVLPGFFASWQHEPAAYENVRPSPTSSPTRTALPLAAVRIVIDPGHQLGNRNFADQINRLVPAGGFAKACNTTGTATSSGFPEATFTWRVARAMQRQLELLGAKVLLTRTGNSNDAWGPCIDERGRFGQHHGADLAISLHGDGAGPAQHGFHVIVPTRRAPWTDDIATASLELGKALRVGLLDNGSTASTYVPGAVAVRSDLGTLNMSDVPIAMVELGNMRNQTDAGLMGSARGQQKYARGVVAGIRRYLNR